ncbi:DNA binding regulatory protein [Lasiodiplodia theobromae]|nr:DNA binding regulatory protein [Lasiodiplodia theobromae]
MVNSYFVHFHRSFPILHRPTFSLSAVPVSLLRVVVAIGSLYTASNLPLPERQPILKEADENWERSRRELKSLVSKDPKEVRESSVIQAFVLLILYGIYRDSGSKFQKARSLFRTIIDSLRDLELFHQTLTAAPSEDPSWSTDLSPALSTSAPSLLHSKWTAYTRSESLKLSLYALVYLDTQGFAAACNTRPLLSPIELGWELPHSAALWEANDAGAWLAALYGGSSPDDSGAAVSMTPGTTRYAFLSSTGATRTLALATQSLLSGSPCPHLVAALSASPFAALCVAANVEALVRDFTRCYYMMPPSLSDPSLFHILTQAQNKHVVAGLRAVGEACTKGRRGGGDGDGNGGGGGAGGGAGTTGSQIWRAVDLVLASAKAGLCAPDDLLIGGIVDNGVAAGLATSAHLTLGSYFASRRSTMQQQKDAADGLVASSATSEVNVAGSLSLLAELMPALEEVVVGGVDEVCDEGPWVTVVMIRLLITIWKTVRHVVEHVRQRSSDGSMAFDPAGVTLRAVTEAVERYIRLLVPDYEPDTGTDQESQEKDWGYHECSLLLLTVELCKRRSAWPVGPALATVFEEIMAAII